MRKLSLSVLLLVAAFTCHAQGFIITPDVEYSTNQHNPSIELGVSAGVQAIANQSSLSIGVFGRRYTTLQDNPNYFSGELSTDLFFFRNLGLDLQTSFVNGEFLDEELTIGDNILCKCTGKVIGKEPDTRGSQERTKLFGSVGLVYKLKNVRISTVYAFKDYNPDNWTRNQGSPYTESVKVGLGYVFELF